MKSANLEIPVDAFNVRGISKAELTDPPMDVRSGGFEDAMVAYATQHLSDKVVRSFAQRPRDKIIIAAGIEEIAFWRIAGEQSKNVGPEPTLIVSAQDNLHRFLYASPNRSESLRIHYKQQSAEGTYLATIENLDVFSGHLSRGKAWLFSAKILTHVEYGFVGEKEEIVLVDFEPEEDRITGALRFRYRQAAQFNDFQIVELDFPSASQAQMD